MAGGIGIAGFQPYMIYNTNQLDRGSMNKIGAVPADVTTRKTDYSQLARTNSNPLGRGESANFIDILQSQMQMSQNNANRIMKPSELAMEMEPAGDGMADSGMDAPWEEFPREITPRDSRSVQDQARMTAEANRVSDVTSGLEVTSMVQGTLEGAPLKESSQHQEILRSDRLSDSFRMRRAIKAYAFSMGMSQMEFA